MEEQKNEENAPSLKDSLPSLSKENLKSLLYLVAGKQDSNLKIFNNPVVISSDDIIELNEHVQEKLQNHNISASITTVDISYEKNCAMQFGTWQEFVDFNWKIPNIVESIIVKWDFTIKLPSHTIDQRHTLTVKICSKFSTLQMMQAVFSKDPHELDKAELETAPIICRVDFINHLLSDELIAVVEKWVEGRKVPPVVSDTVEFFKDQKRILAQTIHYSTPLFISVLFASIMFHFTETSLNKMVNVQIMRYFAYWFLAAGVAIPFSLRVGQFLASLVYTAINEYGFYSIFEVTNGDKKRLAKVAKSNKKWMFKFISSSLISLSLNLAAAFIAYKLFT